MKKFLITFLSLLLVLLLAVGCTPKGQPEHNLDVEVPGLEPGEADSQTTATDAQGNPVEPAETPEDGVSTPTADPVTGIIPEQNELPIIPYEDETNAPTSSTTPTSPATTQTSPESTPSTEPTSSTEPSTTDDGLTPGENELPIIPITP